LMAANQISSLLGLAWKARARMLRAAATSPYVISYIHQYKTERNINNIKEIYNKNN